MAVLIREESQKGNLFSQRRDARLKEGAEPVPVSNLGSISLERQTKQREKADGIAEHFIRI